VEPSFEDVCITLETRKGLYALTICDLWSVPDPDNYGDPVIPGEREFIVYFNTEEQFCSNVELDSENCAACWIVKGMEPLDAAMVVLADLIY